MSRVNKNNVKKRINPKGSDGCILRYDSCGSFRHLMEGCPDSWENMGKKSSNEGLKPVKFGYEAQIISEKALSSSTDFVELKSGVASLKKQNEMLKSEMKEKKAHNRQLKQQADNDKKSQSVKPTIEQFTKTSASDQSCLHQGNMRIGRRGTQNQHKDCETETTNSDSKVGSKYRKRFCSTESAE